MIPETKEFNDIVYHYDNDYERKLFADFQADFQRNVLGNLARVVKRQGRYVVYMREVE